MQSWKENDKQQGPNVRGRVNNNLIKILNTSEHTIHYFSYTSICHLRPQIAKARQGGRRVKVTAVITHDIVK